MEDRLARLRSEPGLAAVLLDVDGTLAPIVARPELAVVPDETRAEVRRLAERYALVGAVSYAFHGELKPGAAAVVGLPAAVGAVLGTGLQQRIQARTLSLGFAALLAGIAIWLLV